MSTIGERIRAVREGEEHGRQEFCKLLDIPKDTLISIEKGKVKKPNFELISNICSLYPQYVNYLLGMPINKSVPQVIPKPPQPKF